MSNPSQFRGCRISDNPYVVQAYFKGTQGNHWRSVSSDKMHGNGKWPGEGGNGYCLNTVCVICWQPESSSGKVTSLWPWEFLSPVLRTMILRSGEIISLEMKSRQLRSKSMLLSLTPHTSEMLNRAIQKCIWPAQRCEIWLHSNATLNTNCMWSVYIVLPFRRVSACCSLPLIVMPDTFLNTSSLAGVRKHYLSFLSSKVGRNRVYSCLLVYVMLAGS